MRSEPPVQNRNMPGTIVYEQPLSERMRAFLRLEFLFARAEHLLQADDVWSSRGALESINEVMAILSRTDLKKELINELDRHAITLSALTRNPKVDQSRLENVLGDVNHVLSALKALETAPGLELREHELLSAVKQRSGIPAGTCDFDLPAYHYWLRSPAEQRMQDLRAWLSAFSYLRDATTLCLKLVRESSIASQEIAGNGFFQKTLETATPCQMIRVSISDSLFCYPEISAGKHRFTVRFMQALDPATRPVQSNDDIDFKLLCCVI